MFQTDDISLAEMSNAYLLMTTLLYVPLNKHIIAKVWFQLNIFSNASFKGIFVSI